MDAPEEISEAIHKSAIETTIEAGIEETLKIRSRLPR